MKYALYNILYPNQGGFVNLTSVLIVGFLMTGGIPVFMGVMYYRSGIHEKFVNEIRQEVLKNQGDERQFCAIMADTFKV